MKSTNISSILRQVLTEDADKQRAKDLGTLRGALTHIQGLIARGGSSENTIASIEKTVKDALEDTKSSDPLSEGEQEVYSREGVKNYIENNPPAKYYRIATTSNSVQQAQSKEKAIEILDQSPIKQFELSRYGQVIQFSAPFDAGTAANAREMGLD